jgi:capsular polysaccharide biosynthesis protein/Mrp family chromosome partitioning ATPase
MGTRGADSKRRLEISPETSLERYLRALRERWLIVALVFFGAISGAVIYATTTPPVYEAQAQLLISPVSDPNLTGVSLIRTSSDPSRDVQTAARLVGTLDVATRTKRMIGAADSPQELLDHLRVEPVAGSDVVAVIAQASTARTARRVANSFARAVIEDRTARLQAQLARAIPRLQALIRRLPSGDSTASKALADRLGALQTLVGGPDPTVTLENLAGTPTAPKSPRKALSIAAGAVLGLLLGMGAAFAADALDSRLRRETQLETLLDLPILTRVPRVRVWNRRPFRPAAERPRVLAPYRMLNDALAALEERSGRQPGTSITFTGAGPAQGCTTTALHYAWMLAAAGERVVLVDEDLDGAAGIRAAGRQRPSHPNEPAGGQRPIAEATRPAEVSGVALRWLPLQALEERLAATRQSRVVDEVLEEADRVVIDAPPLTDGVKALSLARAGDRLVLVVRLGWTRLAALRELAELLSRHAIEPDGIVVVGAGTRPGVGLERRRPVPAPATSSWAEADSDWTSHDTDRADASRSAESLPHRRPGGSVRRRTAPPEG